MSETAIMDPVKLNLGGMGEGYLDGKIKGFKTVDLREGADVVTDVADLSMFQDQSVDEIYSSNVLEHFAHTRTLFVLKEWHRVLRRNGRLWLSVPDFDACIRLYQKEGLTRWLSYLIWGDQAHPLNYHYINFTFGTLAKVLVDAGFNDVKRLINLPYGIKDASKHTDNHFRLPISLNVEAVA